MMQKLMIIVLSATAMLVIGGYALSRPCVDFAEYCFARHLLFQHNGIFFAEERTHWQLAWRA